MKTFIGAAALVMLLASTGWAQCCGTPVMVTAYYSPPVAVAPVYTSYYTPAPMVYTSYYAPAPIYTTYYAPPPVYSTYYGPAPVVFARPVVVRTKVYYPGQPVRNIVRAVLP
jgi:hypothetical protein